MPFHQCFNSLIAVIAGMLKVIIFYTCPHYTVPIMVICVRYSQQNFTIHLSAIIQKETSITQMFKNFSCENEIKLPEGVRPLFLVKIELDEVFEGTRFYINTP